jgi:hypothetical protein
MTGPAPILVAGAGRAGLALALARQGNPSLILMTVVKAGRPTKVLTRVPARVPGRCRTFN